MDPSFKYLNIPGVLVFPMQPLSLHLLNTNLFYDQYISHREVVYPSG